MNDQHTWHVPSVKLSEIAESMVFAGMTTFVIASEKIFSKVCTNLSPTCHS
jgi:hypothetical protein